MFMIFYSLALKNFLTKIKIWFSSNALSLLIFVLQNKKGGIAQLGERLNGIQKVSGSIPLTSTNLHKRGIGCLFFYV